MLLSARHNPPIPLSTVFDASSIATNPIHTPTYAICGPSGRKRETAFTSLQRVQPSATYNYLSLLHLILDFRRTRVGIPQGVLPTIEYIKTYGRTLTTQYCRQTP